MTTPEYAGLARRYADDGDPRMAQLATWAGDVHALELVLHENGIDRAPDPAAQLAAVGASVAASLEAAAAALPDRSLTAREVLETARAAMVAAFDASVHSLLAERFGELDHLDAIGPGAGPRAGVTAQRVGGREPLELWNELRVAASDCATMADLLADEGAVPAAERLAHQADASAYEAYLVLAALRAGDASFATVDLRWDLAAASSTSGRARFAVAVGSAERGALEASLSTT